MSTVFSIGNLEVTVAMIGIPVALIFWAVMALIFGKMYRKTVWAETLSGTKTGKRLNALGFGLLPSLAVFGLFTEGTENALGRISHSGWLKDTLLTAANEEGRIVYRTGRIATVGLLLLFALLVLWLALRRERIPDNGDVLLVAVTELGGLITVMSLLSAEDSIRIGNIPLQAIIGFALMLIPLTVWTVRNGKQKKNTVLTVACWTVFILAAAAIAVREYTDWFGTETLTRTAIRTGATLLAAKAVLSPGRAERSGH